MKHSRLLNLAIGPVLFALFCLAGRHFGNFAAAAAAGTVVWMAYWWVSAPVDYAITGFLPIVVNALFGMMSMPKLLSNYSSETIILLLGSSILTVSWEETGLDRRIAATVLRFVRDSVRSQIVFWFLLSTLLSSVLPNAVVCATLSPIAFAMLKYIGEGDVSKSRVASKILLVIAYGAGLGGLASPLGGAMNLVTVEYIQKLTGHEYMYVDWVGKFLPVMAVLVISNLIFLLRDVGSKEKMSGVTEFFSGEFGRFKPMSFQEKTSLGLFVVATALSFTRQFYKDLLPGMRPAYVFMTAAVVSFLIANRDGKRLMNWKRTQGKIVWEMIYIFAGGLAAGALINDTGAAAIIGRIVSGLDMGVGIGLISVIVVFTLLLSDVTSNTATAAVAIPIVVSIVKGCGMDPIPYVYVASIGVNLSYMFPTSIRAIPVGLGLSPRYMLREGWKMTVMVIVLMILLSWALMPYFSK